MTEYGRRKIRDGARIRARQLLLSDAGNRLDEALDLMDTNGQAAAGSAVPALDDVQTQIFEAIVHAQALIEIVGVDELHGNRPVAGIGMD